MALQKIEYRIVPQDVHPTQAWLNREGADGWQLVAVLMNDHAKASAGYKVIFSRPIQSQASSQDIFATSEEEQKAASEVPIHSSYRSLPK